MADNMNISAAVPPQSQQAPQATASQASRSAVQDAAATQQADKVETEQTVLSAEELKASIDQLNAFMKEGQRSLAFSVDDSSEEVVVKVVDTDTQEIIRQIPNEEALKLKQHIEGMLGLLLTDKA